MAPKICTNLGDLIISMIDVLPDRVRFSKEELIRATTPSIYLSQ